MILRPTLIAVSLALSMTAYAADNTPASSGQGFASLDWQVGPRKQPLADKATIQLATPDQAALNEADSGKFLALTHNLPEPGSYIVVSRDQKWWAVFSFDPMGYVKDDEKIDPDALLKSMKDNDGPSNEARAKQGMPAIETIGWSVPPHYDPSTHQLEWGVKLRSENADGVNYTVRILGREGVMNATLVDDPQSLDKDLPAFKKMLASFQFTPGHKYSEFKPGDHVAELGLGALIVGGAAAVATKKGFWGALGAMIAAGWKAIAAAFVAVGAWIKSRLGKKK